MAEAATLFALITDIQTPGLIVGGVGIRHHFHKLAGARHPHFQVPLPVAGEITGVAMAFVDDSIG